MSDTSPPVTTVVQDGIAVVTLDDGKANAVSHQTLAAVHAALDAAEADDGTGAVVLAGRPGRFSAGFDLATMTSSVQAMRELVTGGAELMARMVTFPLPIVAAGTGHALAAGALLLLASDTRVGADLDCKVGLNEVGIGMQLPVFAIALAQERLDPQAVLPATLQAQVYGPAEAVEVGYLDEVVAADDVVPTAIARASDLAQIRRGAYAETKARLRGPVAERMLAGLTADLSTVAAPTP